MKVYEVYTLRELIDLGWSISGSYRKHQLLKNGDKHILWNPENNVVEFVF